MTALRNSLLIFCILICLTSCELIEGKYTKLIKKNFSKGAELKVYLCKTDASPMQVDTWNIHVIRALFKEGFIKCRIGKKRYVSWQGDMYPISNVSLTEKGKKYLTRYGEKTLNNKKKCRFAALKVADQKLIGIISIRDNTFGSYPKKSITIRWRYTNLTPIAKILNEHGGKTSLIQLEKPRYDERERQGFLTFTLYEDGWRITNR